jgi:hypothetical protein
LEFVENALAYYTGKKAFFSRCHLITLFFASKLVWSEKLVQLDRKSTRANTTKYEYFKRRSYTGKVYCGNQIKKRKQQQDTTIIISYNWVFL